MAYCWIISESGQSQARDVLESDHRSLTLDGYQAYHLEWHGAEGRHERTKIYAKQLPTPHQCFRAVEGLFGGSGTLRVWHPSGDPYLP